MNDNVSLHLVETPSKHMKEQCDVIQYDMKGNRKSNRGIIFPCSLWYSTWLNDTWLNGSWLKCGMTETIVHDTEDKWREYNNDTHHLGEKI